jgi:ceramide synthetase
MNNFLGEAARLLLLLASNEQGEEKPVDLYFSFCVGMVYAVMIFIWIWASRLVLIEPIARILLKQHLKSTDSKKSQNLLQAKVQKFAQSTTEMMTYGVFSIIGMHVLHNEPWLWPSMNWWATCGDNPDKLGWCCWKVDWFGVETGWDGKDLKLPCRSMERPPMNEKILCYYVLYGARYLQAIVCVLLEHRRKDFVEMIVHHVTTAVLIGLSFSIGYTRYC